MMQHKPIHAAYPPPVAHVTAHAKVWLHQVQARKRNDTCQLPQPLSLPQRIPPIKIHSNIQHMQLSTKVNITWSCKAWPSLQNPLPANPQWMAQVIQPHPADCLTLLGHLGWTVHWGWYPPEGRPSMCPPCTWQDPCWPPQHPPRNRKDAVIILSSSLLAQYWCRYIRLCKEMPTVYMTQGHTAVQPILSHNIPDSPQQEIRADYFVHKGKDYLLICNLFSKYPSFIYMTTTKQSTPHPKNQDLISQYMPPGTFTLTMDPPLHLNITTHSYNINR